MTPEELSNNIAAMLAAGSDTKPKLPHNSKAVILNAKEICERLKISQRTLYRRLATDWGSGYWFFKINDKWHIRESHLEDLIGLMETGQIKV